MNALLRAAARLWVPTDEVTRATVLKHWRAQREAAALGGHWRTYTIYDLAIENLTRKEDEHV